MFLTKLWATAAAAVVSIVLPGVSLAATLNVPGNFATIQACIDAAVSGVDECVVAPGTYHETINFLGKAITLRSSGGADVTTIDATGIGGSVITCSSGEGADTVLYGFTITGGTGTDRSGNGTTRGGGMFNYYSSPTVTDCIFKGNTVTNYGGGIYNLFGRSIVSNCTFEGNTALRGGGIYDSASAYEPSALVTSCAFRKNAANRGGAIYNFFGAPIVSNCTFDGNNAVAGGGIYNFSSGAAVTNSAFRGNTGSLYGGGIVNDGTYLTGTTFTNSTFAGNKGGAGGAMYNFFPCDPQIMGCIFWGNNPDEIRTTDFYAAPNLLFSDVQGGVPVGSIDGGGNIDLDPMFVRPPDPGPDGNWDGVDDDYGDLRLQAGSPCINAGDPGFVPQPGETDLDGHARVLCEYVDMGAYEFGIGDYDCDQTVDLTDFADWSACMTGPMLSHVATEPRSHEGTIQYLQSEIGNWQLAIPCESFDFDGDGDVDIFDFAAFQIIIGP